MDKTERNRPATDAGNTSGDTSPATNNGDRQMPASSHYVSRTDDILERNVDNHYNKTQSKDSSDLPRTDNGKTKSIEDNNVHPYNRPRNPIWIDIAAIIGVWICASMLGGAIQFIAMKTGGATAEFGTFLSYVISFGITIAFALWMGRRRTGKWPHLKFSLKKSSPTLILWGVVLVFVTSMVLEPLLDLFPTRYMEFLSNAIGRGGWALLTTVVMAPILEETLFRGIIQESVAREYGPLRGLFIAAAIFGIIHILPQQVVNAFFVGLVLGYIYIRTGSLVPVIIIHAINNALAYIMMVVFEDRAWVSTREIMGSDGWYWVLYAICAVIFVIACFNVWSQLKKLEQKTEAV